MQLLAERAKLIFIRGAEEFHRYVEVAARYPAYPSGRFAQAPDGEGEIRCRRQANKDPFHVNRLSWMNSLKVVSGGQTGVDRAALDTAEACGIRLGGWCPAGRRAEDGPIDTRFPLVETPSDNYSQRTEWNVRDSDATLVLLGARATTGGTKLTIDCAVRLGRPLRILVLDDEPVAESVARWIVSNNFAQLNVAGPRESECPGVYGLASRFLRRVFAELSTEAPGKDRA